jgi:RsiW-degrading membrane proteinase PrsW (M82 family)
VPPSPRPEYIHWRSILFGGIALFVVLGFVMLQTGNPNLYPTVVLLGGFLVPVTFVAFLYDHLHGTSLAFEAVMWAFVIGGLLGVLGASVLEPLILPRAVSQTGMLQLSSGLLVGVIEEGSKLAAVVFVARRMTRKGPLDGLLLGAAVGMGFAALESTGYAFTVLIASGGDVIASLEETVLRAIIAPFGHGIWTGIAAAALFSTSPNRGWRIGPVAVLAFAFVVVLHAAWDGLQVGGPVSLLGFRLPASVIALSVVGIIAFVAVYRAAERVQAPPDM